MTTFTWLRFYALKVRNFLYFEISPVHRLRFLGNHFYNLFIKKPRSLSVTSSVIKKVYVISLTFRLDRRMTISGQLNALSISFELHEGVDLRQKEEVREYFVPRSIHNLSHGALGCAASHIKLWQKIADMEPGLYVVLEDDVSFGDDFINQLANLQENYPADADIFYLGSRNTRLRDILYCTDFGYARCYNPRMGAFAYCITPETAKKILAFVLPIDLLCGGIDTALGIGVRKGKIAAYQFQIQQVFHSFISSSNIYNPSVPTKPLHKSAITKWPWV